MTLAQTGLALLALLLTPGPTNTLLALAGAEVGWRRALRLIPFELSAYLAVTVPLALAGAAVMAALPALKPVVTLAAGLWVMALAAKMWRLPSPGQADRVSGRRVLVTTLLNPKALVIGLALLPGGALAPRIAVLAALIIGVAALWAALGACLAGGGNCLARRTGPLFHRIAALWLGILALGLMLNAAQAAI